jgi:CheY-like chemotaxis protein
MAMCLLLIVEDDRDTRLSLAQLLVGEGYDVCEAADVTAGLSTLRAFRPDLVLLDYAIPERRDGEEFLRTKAADPQAASIPVVVMSGFSGLRHLDGVVAFIAKPFDVDDLLALVRRFAGPPEKPHRRTAA